MPRATKEDYEREEFKAYVGALENLEIKPKDPKKPLAEFPPTRLKHAVKHITGEDDPPGFKRFVETFTTISGSGVDRRMVSEWLRDSRTITDFRLAQVIDLITRYAIDEGTQFASDATLGLFSYFDDFYFSTYDRVHIYATAAVFGVTAFDHDLAEKVALVDAVLCMGRKETHALLSVANLCEDIDAGVPDFPEACAALTIERLDRARKSFDRLDENARKWAEVFAKGWTEEDEYEEPPF